MMQVDRGKPPLSDPLIGLKDVRPGMKNLHIMFIVLEVGKSAYNLTIQGSGDKYIVCLTVGGENDLLE